MNNIETKNSPSNGNRPIWPAEEQRSSESTSANGEDVALGSAQIMEMRARAKNHRGIYLSLTVQSDLWAQGDLSET